jgi:hypothetical protein
MTKKKAGIRAIDKGTRYDIPGNLISIARRLMRAGGDWNSAVVILGKPGPQGTVHCHIESFGTADSTRVAAMIRLAETKTLTVL